MSETETNTPRARRESAPQLSTDDLLSLITQLLGDVSARGHRVRTMNHNGALIIQVANVQRVANDAGVVRLVEIAPLAPVAQPVPDSEPVAAG